MPTLADDGDVIKGLGFVALYTAYLEESVDECVDVLLAADPEPDDRMHRRPTSEKVRYSQRQLERLAPLPAELSQLPAVLAYVIELLEQRNQLVHGRIYAEYGAPDRLRSGRRGVPDREVTSAELYELANTIFEIRTPLMHASMFALPRLNAKQP